MRFPPVRPTGWRPVALRGRKELDHSLARFRIGQTPGPGLHVVFEMLGMAGRGKGAGPRRMRDDPFKKKLRPGAAIESPRPLRQWLRAPPRKQIAPPKGPVDDDRHLS